jgi:hypothetical protein
VSLWPSNLWMVVFDPETSYTQIHTAKYIIRKDRALDPWAAFEHKIEVYLYFVENQNLIEI